MPASNPQPRPRQSDTPPSTSWMGKLLAMGSVLSGLVVLGVGGGYLLDHSYGTSPRWTLILGIISIMLGLYQIVRMGSRL